MSGLQRPLSHSLVRFDELGECAGRYMIPRVLITHTLLWPNAARLALAFGALNCDVQVLCRRSHPAGKLPSIERSYVYNPFAPLRSLRAALEDADPDLVVPCDDRAVEELHQLYNIVVAPGTLSRRIQELIERSLGKPASYVSVSTRSKLAEIAGSAGVLLPSTEVVMNLIQLREWLHREGFPAVLKADFTSGGDGVAFLHDMKGAEASFMKLSSRPNIATTLGKLGLKFDSYLLRQRLRGIKPKLSVQALIRGKPANCAVACWEGKVIAGIAVEVVAAHSLAGNATVVRIVDGHEMLEAASRIVSYLGMSGFCGFDFMIEETTGLAFMIEINPRATQINHLALGKGRNLPAALRARVAGEPVNDGFSVTDQKVIALYPQEWQRDPHSNFLETDFHDLPEEPELIRFYLKRQSRQFWPRFCKMV